MVKRKKLNITILLLVPLFIIFLGAMSKQREEKESPAVQSVKAQYAEHGPYQVGIQNYKTESERVLEITVWYPALDEDTLDQEITYRYEINRYYINDLTKHFTTAFLLTGFCFWI